MSNLVRVRTDHHNADRGAKLTVALPKGAYVPGASRNDGLARPGELIEGLSGTLVDKLVEANLVRRVKAPAGHVPDEDGPEPRLPKLAELADFLADKTRAEVEAFRARDRRTGPGKRASKIYAARLKELIE